MKTINPRMGQARLSLKRYRLPLLALALLKLCLVLSFSAASPARAEEEDDEWKIKWDKSFHLDSPDRQFQLQFGGRLHAEATFTDTDSAIDSLFGEIEDSSEIRRGRLYFKGTLYGNFEFKAEYDFAGGDPTAKDLYVGLKKTPIGNIRLGHFKEPFSLSELNSSNDNSFIERPLPIILAPSRNTGIMVHDSGKRYTWAVGAFRESDDVGFSSGDGQLNLTGHATFLPVYRDSGRQLFHFGVSVSHKDLGDAFFRYRQRPEIHVSPRLVDSGSFQADAVDLWGAEVAAVSGPFWASAEYVGAETDGATLRDLSFSGYYVEAGWFLTGEHRKYKTGNGVFSRPSPKKNFGDEGKGAWELAVRYSTLDLNRRSTGNLQNTIRPNQLDNLSLGVNWYLNPVARFMFNYIDSDLEGVGNASFLLLRMQLVF